MATATTVDDGVAKDIHASAQVDSELAIADAVVATNLDQASPTLN